MILPPDSHQKSASEPPKSLQQATRLLVEKDQIIQKKSDVIKSQQNRIHILEEALRLEKVKRFGPSSEQSPDQGQLFDEVEALVHDHHDVCDDTEENSTQKPPKKKSGRKGLNPNLERVQERHGLTDAEKAGAIDTFWVKKGEKLDIIPAQARVIEVMQEKAVFLDDNDQRQLIAAEIPTSLLGKAIASINTLSYLIVAKYQDALPLYRLEKQFERFGGDISRTSMANWLNDLSHPLQALMNLMLEHAWQGELIQMDETRIQVLKEQGKDPTGDKWMWVLRGGPPDQPVILFEYDPSRSQAVPLRLLEGYQDKKLQTDGYAAYSAVVKENRLIFIGCWDHARRKFDEALKASKPNKKQGKVKNTAPSKAQMGLSLINKLYRIERDVKEATESERYQARQTCSKVILKKLKAWLDTNVTKVPKDSLTGKAIHYTLNQWEKLTRYVNDGSTPISNILAENAIRPFCIGRRNWLFADTPEGARASATYYSLIETAKANGWVPYEYFQIMLKQLPHAETVDDIEALLPWNLKNPKTVS